MDNIYQSVKGLCRAIINLLVAVVDLLAGILNGIACLFEKIRPHASWTDSGSSGKWKSEIRGLYRGRECRKKPEKAFPGSYEERKQDV